MYLVLAEWICYAAIAVDYCRCCCRASTEICYCQYITAAAAVHVTYEITPLSRSILVGLR